LGFVLLLGVEKKTSLSFADSQQGSFSKLTFATKIKPQAFLTVAFFTSVFSGRETYYFLWLCAWKETNNTISTGLMCELQ